MSLHMLTGWMLLFSMASHLSAQDWVTYDNCDGRELTNESFSVWFFPWENGCRTRRALDLGDKTRMTETSCITTNKNIAIARDVLRPLVSLSTNRFLGEVDSDFGKSVMISAHLDGADYACNFGGHAFDDARISRLNRVFREACSQMLTHSNNSFSVRSWLIDKTNAPPIKVSFSRVLSEPDVYIGKRVAITAYYWKREETASLFDTPPKMREAFPHFPYQDAIYVGRTLNGAAGAVFAGCNEAVTRLDVEGLIYAEVVDGRTQAGDMGLWPLAITEITKVEKVAE